MDTIRIEFEIKLNKGLETVWSCLVEETNRWWRKDFYTNPKTKRFILEPFLGGKMYEDFGGNEGLTWANVIGIDSPNSLDLIAHLTPQFGGPALSFIKITLRKTSEGTLFTFSDCSFGDVDQKSRSEIEEGWKMIYEDSFKSYVESR